MFGIKLSPKGVKLCPGCPPKQSEPIRYPRFNMGTPKKKEKDTKVIKIVDLSQYKKKNDTNALF